LMRQLQNKINGTTSKVTIVALLSQNLKENSFTQQTSKIFKANLHKRFQISL
jgi:hypothetical protein